jgi:hypothetical protein
VHYPTGVSTRQLPDVSLTTVDVGDEPAKGKVRVFVNLNYINNGSEGSVENYFSSLLGNVKNTSQLLRSLRDQANSLANQGSKMESSIGAHQPGFFTIHIEVDHKFFKPFREGKTLYYYGGILVIKSKDGQQQIPYCGIVQYQGNSSVVHNCPPDDNLE